MIILQWWHLRHEHIFPGEVFCFCPQLTNYPENENTLLQMVSKMYRGNDDGDDDGDDSGHDDDDDDGDDAGNDDEILNNWFPLCHL